MPRIRPQTRSLCHGLDVEDLMQRTSGPGDACDAFLATIDLVGKFFILEAHRGQDRRV